MNGLALRAVAGIFGAVLLLTAAWLIRDRFHQKDLADAAASCAVAASAGEDDAPLTDCLPQIRREVAEARQARTCERALVPQLRPETRFAMAQSCGAGVKRLVATGDAAADRADSLDRQLADARADLNSAVERAERRTARSTEREANGRKVIEAAPRAPGGSIRCDADCLRQLGQ